MSIPTIEPAVLTAGDTAKWKLTLDDYPSGTWALSYSLRANGLAEIEIDAQAQDDDTHLVHVPFQWTGTWTPGLYEYQGYVTDNVDRFTARHGFITIKADFDTSTADPRSHARIMLDAIETVLEGGAFREESSVTLPDGRTIAYSDKSELLKLRNYYRAEVEAEEAAADIAAGKASGRRILLRFTAP